MTSAPEDQVEGWRRLRESVPLLVESLIATLAQKLHDSEKYGHRRKKRSLVEE
jgi:hypothetical protein